MFCSTFVNRGYLGLVLCLSDDLKWVPTTEGEREVKHGIINEWTAKAIAIVKEDK